MKCNLKKLINFITVVNFLLLPVFVICMFISLILYFSLSSSTRISRKAASVQLCQTKEKQNRNEHFPKQNCDFLLIECWNSTSSFPSSTLCSALNYKGNWSLIEGVLFQLNLFACNNNYVKVSFKLLWLILNWKSNFVYKRLEGCHRVEHWHLIREQLQTSQTNQVASKLMKKYYFQIQITGFQHGFWWLA